MVNTEIGQNRIKKDTETHTKIAIQPIGSRVSQATTTSDAASLAPGNRAAQRNVVDIGALSKDELLEKLRGYINSMCAFAQANKNVYKELKETLLNSNRVMAQYVKAVNLDESSKTNT
jgi:hypothetical protein